MAVGSASFDPDKLIDSGFLLPKEFRQEYRRRLRRFAATRMGQGYAQAIERGVNPILAGRMMRVMDTETPAGMGLRAAVTIAKDTPIIAVKGTVHTRDVCLRWEVQKYTWQPEDKDCKFILSQWDASFSNEARYINAPSEGETANVRAEWICEGKMLILVASEKINKKIWMLIDYPLQVLFGGVMTVPVAHIHRASVCVGACMHACLNLCQHQPCTFACDLYQFCM